MQNKSQAGEGTLYYEFTINNRFSERTRIESPRFDQVIRVTLNTNHFDASKVWQTLTVQMRARKVSNDCVSGPTAKHDTPANPWFRP
jgi:transcriptional regulator NrdR family protein